MMLLDLALKATMLLALCALIFSMVIAIPVGVLSAVQRGGWIDQIGRVFAMLGQAMPAFWVGLLYDDAALDAAWDLVKDFTMAERHALRDGVPKLALGLPFRGGTVRDLLLHRPAHAVRGGQAGSAAVSYTHLRAHETVLDLVCRLLLEKKNKHHP